MSQQGGGPVTALERPRPRRRYRAVWVTIAVTGAAVVILPVLAAAAVLAIHHQQDATSFYRRPVAALNVSAPGAVITVQAGQPGQVQVYRHLIWNLGPRPQVRQTWAGRTLTVTTTACGRKSLPQCSVQLDIQVPAGVTLQADASSGELGVTGLTGAVHAQVTSGAVNLASLHGPVWAQASSGDISGTGLATAQVDAAVDSGTLALGFVLPPQRVSAAATSGSVAVSVPRGSRYRVTGTTTMGSRGIDPALVSRTSRRLIEVTTTSGVAGVGYAPGPLPPAGHPSPATPAPPGG